MRDIPSAMNLPPKLAQNMLESAAKGSPEAAAERACSGGVSVVTRLSAGYPVLLTEIDNPPPVLYFKGCMPDFTGMSCGIVGSRRPTKKGLEGARKLAYELAMNKAVIVSGMATGVDAAGHEGALEANGKTVAVLGCGPDVIYPGENEELYHRILEDGAVVSEFLPGTPPVARHFPQRNRIIAGLSRVLLAGEGMARSGARITVDFALQQGREVYALPFDAGSPLSWVPTYLMESGAPLAKSAADVLDEAGGGRAPRREKEHPNMDADQTLVYQALLAGGQMTADEISIEAGIAMKELNILLTVMEMRGIICACVGGRFRIQN
jgi:DNA processing protein